MRPRRSGGIVGIIATETDDLAPIVDVVGGCHGGAGHVDGGEPTLVPQEAMELAVGVDVARPPPARGR